jgi:hypothetical protein
VSNDDHAFACYEASEVNHAVTRRQNWVTTSTNQINPAMPWKPILRWSIKSSADVGRF